MDENKTWYFAGLFDANGGVYANVTGRGETSTVLTLSGTQRGAALIAEVGGGVLRGNRLIFTGHRATRVARLLHPLVSPSKRPQLEVFLAIRESLETRAVGGVQPNMDYRRALIQNLRDVRAGWADPIRSYEEWSNTSTPRPQSTDHRLAISTASAADLPQDSAASA